MGVDLLATSLIDLLFPHGQNSQQNCQKDNSAKARQSGPSPGRFRDHSVGAFFAPPGQALLSEVVSRRKPNNTLTFFIPFFPAGGAGGAMPLGVFFAPVGRALLSGVGVRRKPDNALHRHLPVGVVWRQDCLGCGVPGSIGPSGLLCAQAACGKLVRS